MTAIVKPDFENVWASEGGSKAPSIEQILNGWKQNQFPPSEVANFLQNKIESAIQYLFQVGIPDWDSKVEYRVSSLVRFTGKIYMSKSVNVNKTPTLSTADWKVAFDEFGASDDLRLMVQAIVSQDGYLPWYVRKSDPVMTNKAKAPSFESDVGITAGFKFKGYSSSVSCNGGDLLFISNGNTRGRIKEVEPTMEMNDETLVTTALLKKVIDDVIAKTKKMSEIPIGYTLITRNRKPPSDADQLGYGIWELDCQGRALVGVSLDTAVTTPEWVKDADAKEGEYKHKMTIAELVPHAHPIGGRWQDGGSGGVQGGNKSVEYVTSTNETGGGEPFNIVQPSHTKFLWTRVG